MSTKRKSLKIAYISSWPPKECGIATFTFDLSKSIARTKPEWKFEVIVLHEDPQKKRTYSKQASHIVYRHDRETYKKVAEWVNANDFDVVSLQHEFGLYGEKDGKNLLAFLETVKTPIVTSLHTLPLSSRAKRKRTRLRLLRKIVEYSSFTVITGESAKNDLIEHYEFPRTKLKSILHGTPEIKKLEPRSQEALKGKLGFQGKTLLFTFGLLRKSKGIEYMIRALPRLIKKHPDLLYVIAGEFQKAPKKYGNYERKLKDEVKKENLDDHVLFLDGFQDDQNIIRHLQAADYLITPYLVPEQVSSGVLSWGVAAGKIILSTPYVSAQELLSKGRGAFIQYRNVSSIEKTLSELLDDPAKGAELAQRAYSFGKRTAWKQVAKQYSALFEVAAKQKRTPPFESKNSS